MTKNSKNEVYGAEIGNMQIQELGNSLPKNQGYMKSNHQGNQK